jgi:hypothetical protein
VFIIANPRSGTTFLHRLITLDKERFTFMTLADTLFCSVSFVRFRLWLSRTDKALNNPIRRLTHAVESRLFSGWKGIHDMSFGQPEEDEGLFAQMMQSSGIFILFPFVHLIKSAHFLDKEEKSVRSRVMDCYENSLKRFVYATGNHKIYLTKNVNSTGRIQSLLQRFPDARFIYIFRNPLEALPSTANMFSVMYPLHSPAIKKHEPPYREWCELSIEFYKYFAQTKNLMGSERIVAIAYEDLVKYPVLTLEKIYRHFGWNFSCEFKSTIETEIKERRSFKSKNKYTLEAFGYTKEEILLRLQDVMEKIPRLEPPNANV